MVADLTRDIKREAVKRPFDSAAEIFEEVRINNMSQLPGELLKYGSNVIAKPIANIFNRAITDQQTSQIGPETRKACWSDDQSKTYSTS